MYDLHILNPFLSNAFNIRQLYVTSPVGSANKIQTNLVFKKPCTDLVVFEYVENTNNIQEYGTNIETCFLNHNCRNNHYWSIAVIDRQNYTSADQMYAFINQHLVISPIQTSLKQIARDCTIKFNLPKIIIRCSKEEIIGRLGSDIIVNKIYCKFIYTNSGDIIMQGDTVHTDIKISAAYSDDKYDLFLSTNSFTTSFNEPYLTTDFGIKNGAESLKVNKKTNNFTIMYRQNQKGILNMGSNLNVTFSSLVCSETFDEIVGSICIIILAQYHKINQNHSRLFTENELMSEMNFNKKCVEQCFKYAIERLMKTQIKNKKGNRGYYINKFSKSLQYAKNFSPIQLKAVDSMQSYLNLWNVDISMLTIAFGTSILNKIGIPLSDICKLFTINALTNMEEARQKKFWSDLKIFIKDFADSYIDHVFSVMCFYMADDNDTRVDLRNTNDLVAGTYIDTERNITIIDDDVEYNVLRFNKYLFVVFYVFLRNNVNNQLTLLSKNDQSYILSEICELYDEIKDCNVTTSYIIENKIKILLTLTVSTGEQNRLLTQLWDISRSINEKKLNKKSYDFYLIEENVNGSLRLTHKIVKMHSSNTNSKIHSQHGVQVITHVNDYVTKPVSVTDIVTTAILANGVLGDNVSIHVVPFVAWTISKNKTLSCCTKKLNDSLISYGTRLITIVDELGGIDSNTLITVANPMINLFNLITIFKSYSVSHCDLKADNFLVELIEHRETAPCNVELPSFKSSGVLGYIEILADICKNNSPPLPYEFLIKMIDLESFSITPELYLDGKKKVAIYNIPSISIAISSREMLSGLASIDSFDYYPLWLMCINTAVLLPLLSLTNVGCNMKLLILIINQQIKNHLESKSTLYQYLGEYIRRFFGSLLTPIYMVLLSTYAGS